MPAITDPVAIDGFTAPGFTGTPVVTVNARGLAGNFVGTSASGTSALGNGADGVAVVGANGTSANTIVTNVGYGLLAVGSCRRTRVIRNLISGNTQGNVNLAASSGITYVP